jgi:GPR1/FUN34/yaaH family
MVTTGLTTALLQGANTAITEGGTANLAFAFGMFYGGLAQLLAGMVRVTASPDIRNCSCALPLPSAIGGGHTAVLSIWTF